MGTESNAFGADGGQVKGEGYGGGGGGYGDRKQCFWC